MAQLEPSEEKKFRAWLAGILGANIDPDDPKHQYDYRAAYQAGQGPDEFGRWPARFKQISAGFIGNQRARRTRITRLQGRRRGGGAPGL